MKAVIRILHYPRLEVIAVTKTASGDLIRLSPDPDITEVRCELVTDAQSELIAKHWARIRSHSVGDTDWYFATKQIVAWAHEWPIDCFPTVEDLNDDGLVPFKKASSHPSIRVSRQTLTTYARVGRINPKTQKIVKLKTVRSPTGRMVKVSDFKEFIALTTVDDFS